jgi:hypothetical protein
MVKDTNSTPTYEVERGVPIPDPPKGSVPLSSMGVGDSIKFPIEERSRVLSSASKLKTRKGMQFTVKTIDQTTCRVWRIK